MDRSLVVQPNALREVHELLDELVIALGDAEADQQIVGFCLHLLLVEVARAVRTDLTLHLRALAAEPERTRLALLRPGLRLVVDRALALLPGGDGDGGLGLRLCLGLVLVIVLFVIIVVVIVIVIRLFAVCGGLAVGRGLLLDNAPPVRIAQAREPRFEVHILLEPEHLASS